MELKYFIIRRTMLLVPTLVGVTILAFIFLRSFPDSVLVQDFINPLSSSAGGTPGGVAIAKAKIELGLNYPVPVQYFYFLLNLLRGNWGFATRPITGGVFPVIGYMWPNTAQLLIFTLILAGVIGIPLGTFLGSRPNTVSDNSGRIFALIGYAMPQFFFGLLLLVIFGKGVIHWPGSIFPVFGMVTIPVPPPHWLVNQNLGLVVSSPTHMILFDALIHGDYRVAFSAFMHLVLPVITLTYAILAMLVRTLRSGMIDASAQEYIRTAQAKGIPRKAITKVHTRKNALIPTVTVMGILMSYLMTGIIVVETLFSYQGLGWFISESVIYLQIYSIIYASIIFGMFIVIASLVTDIVYAYIDPRIRY